MARILIIMLVAAVIGGGVVYAAMLYQDRNPVQVEFPALGSRPSSDPTPTTTTELVTSPSLAPITATPMATAIPSTALTPAAPVATVAPGPASPTAAPTEREIVVNAFGECAGEYSGAHKRFRMQAADDAIADGRQTAADVRRLVEEHCGGVFPQLLVAAPPLPAASPAETGSVEAQPATATPKPTDMPKPTDTPQSVAALSPDLRHIEEKRHMLEMINAERSKAGVSPVVLGDNVAAQLHAESSLENCFSGHWGLTVSNPTCATAWPEGTSPTGRTAADWTTASGRLTATAPSPA